MLKRFSLPIMLDQDEVIGLAVALFVVMVVIIVLSACFCHGKVKMTNNAMRYDRYGRPIVVVATTDNGHTGVPHHHTEFAHNHTGFGNHYAI